MDAAWDYIDAMQGRINYNSDGSYDFKGVYCSVAGKSIARRFTSTTDCVVRYVRENPRTGTDTPDDFEQMALNSFAGVHASEGVAEEYYAVESYDGVPALRYLSALRIKNGCLKCHGTPAGELDETGFPKEGLSMGDLAGAVSIVVPMASFEQEAAQRTFADVGLFVLCLACVVGCMMFVSAALRRSRAEVERANQELERANEALRQESAYKSNFLSIMSHELRTPVASTLALADVWDKTASQGASPDEARIVAMIQKNSVALLETINNTLDAAKIDANSYPVSFDEVDLVDVFDDIEQTIAPLAAQRGVNLRVVLASDIPVLHTDPDILRKISVNLLSNAVKFTPPGGSVRIETSWSDDILCLIVADSGIGMTPEELCVVFERFRQADSSISRRFGGSGLGLSLVREMTELLGGSVCADSKPGVGSAFVVEIPCAQVVEGDDTGSVVLKDEVVASEGDGGR